MIFLQRIKLVRCLMNMYRNVSTTLDVLVSSGNSLCGPSETQPAAYAYAEALENLRL